MTAQLSREELQQIADTDHVQCGDAAAMARMLLAATDSEPVAIDEIAEQAGIDPDFADAYMQGYHDAESRKPSPVAGSEPVAWRWNYGGSTNWRLTETKPNFVGKSVQHFVEPLYAATPAPVAVSEEVFNRAYERYLKGVLCGDSNKQAALSFLNACRAAMQSDVTLINEGDNHSEHTLDMGKAEPVTAATVPDGWTSNCDADAALVMLDRVDTIDCADDERIESVKIIIRRLAAATLVGNCRENENPSTNNFRENSETSTKCWCRTCRPVDITDMRFVVCPDCGNKRCPRANDHRNACSGSNEPGQTGSAYPAAPEQEV